MNQFLSLCGFVDPCLVLAIISLATTLALGESLLDFNKHDSSGYALGGNLMFHVTTAMMFHLQSWQCVRGCRVELQYWSIVI